MRRLFLLMVALGLVATACGGDDGVAADGVWARNSPMMASAGAVYLDLTSGDADTLIGASVESSIAGKVEIHETAPADAEMTDDSDAEMTDDSMDEGMGGAMTMREVGQITLPAGETVNLEPGGYHIMLLDVATPLELGDKFDLTLTFENADEMVVEVEVREQAP
ncbi:MAG: copper chaperone PCu(A)C [bacterium]|nr:copper chaperone PCu(A)C [bacterium]MCP4964292.1 copper chaperone PCu(A)C [bacterium]